MYDTIIIGGGPAGLTAAIYAARYKLKTLVLSGMIGGAITESPDVCNYPGYKKVTGLSLMHTTQEQAKELGAEIIMEEVKEITKSDPFTVKTSSHEYQARSIILCQGMKRRKLKVPGETEFTGKGVSYCATCDAAFFRDKKVGVVGGNDSAAIAALLLAEFAEKVYIIYRKDKLRAEPAWIDKIEKDEKIEVIFNTNVTEIKGDAMVEKVIFDDGKEFELGGLFIEIGGDPDSLLAKDLGVELDESGFIKVDTTQKTNIRRVYAAGDITDNLNKFMQVVTAQAEGALAANSVYTELKKE